MGISHYRVQKIMLLSRMNLGLASDDLEEVTLYNYYKRYINPERKEN
tara:strand:- start:772 stop:912 length:141 start_codon:yes stop_codon:yes gene_type:complete